MHTGHRRSIQRWPELVAYLETEARATEVDFQYLNRPNRNGFKSGACNFGMQKCSHPLVLIPMPILYVSRAFSNDVYRSSWTTDFGCTDSLDLPQQI